MEENKYMGYTPDYIDKLLPKQIFVFGSNALGYHTGGASGAARKRFGAIWGQAEGLQGQSYAIPVDYGRNVRKDTEVKSAVERFITFAKEHPELFFLVTRVGCGIAGYQDKEMAVFFKDALELKNVSLPKSFVETLGVGEIDYDLNRFIEAQDTGNAYNQVLKEIKEGKKQSQRIWFIFPQIKGLGHSYNSEFYGLNGIEEAKAYLEHPELGSRLKEITMALLDCDKLSIDEIFDFPDNLKVRSCMTLFDNNMPITSVKVWREWKYIDLCVEVTIGEEKNGDHYAILIENKYYGKLRENQLSDYKKVFDDYYDTKGLPKSQRRYKLISCFVNEKDVKDIYGKEIDKVEGFSAIPFYDLINNDEYWHEKDNAYEETESEIFNEFWLRRW